jgi:putative ABC transport system permease protein
VNLFTLVRRNVWRHPVRSGLTFLFATLALFLFVFLRSAVTTLESAAKAAATNRLAVQSAVSLFVYMPYSYRARIAQVEGVESVNMWNWFGGYYREPENFFAQFATDMAVNLEQFPEIEVPPDQVAALLEDRKGALVGRALAEKFGWEPGKRVQLMATIYALRPTWEFDVRAVYRSTRPNIDEMTMFFHWDYLQEAREGFKASGFDVADQDVGVFMVKVKEGHEPVKVIEAIDRLFENGPQRVRTQTEAAFQAQFVSMFGGLPTFLAWIGGAVVFAIFFSVLNTAQMAARERARDVGVLKALGFRDALAGNLLLLESMLVVGVGGMLGVGLGWLSGPAFRGAFGFILPNYHVDPATLGAGVVLALAIGLVGGIVPALRLARLRPVTVLREEA